MIGLQLHNAMLCHKGRVYYIKVSHMHTCWQIGPLSVYCLPHNLQHVYLTWYMQVITKQVDGHKYEPFEEAVIEVPEEHVGPVVDMLGQRKGQMMDLVAGTDTTSLTRYMLIASATVVEQLACALSPCSLQS